MKNAGMNDTTANDRTIRYLILLGAVLFVLLLTLAYLLQDWDVFGVMPRDLPPNR